MVTLEEKYNDLVYMICKLNKQIDELQKRCEKLEERESIHNTINDTLNIQKQLDKHDAKIDKLKTRLNMIFGAGGGVHLATYGMMIEKNETPTDEDVRKAAKVIHDYCHNAKSCYVCPFRITNKAGMDICTFTGIVPAGWHTEEKKNG